MKHSQEVGMLEKLQSYGSLPPQSLVAVLVELFFVRVLVVL